MHTCKYVSHVASIMATGLGEELGGHTLRYYWDARIGMLFLLYCITSASVKNWMTTLCGITGMPELECWSPLWDVYLVHLVKN